MNDIKLHSSKNKNFFSKLAFHYCSGIDAYLTLQSEGICVCYF